MVRTGILIILFCVFGIGAYFFFFGKTSEVPIRDFQEELPASRSLQYETSVEGDELTIFGTVSTLDACETATASARTTAAGAILIEIAVPKTEGPCLMRPGRVEFSVRIEAEDYVPIEFLVNGISPNIEKS